MAGTEDGRLVVATPKANAFESILSLESTPTMLTVLGDRSAECRIFVACRNGAVLLVKVRVRKRVGGPPLEGAYCSPAVPFRRTTS